MSNEPKDADLTAHITAQLRIIDPTLSDTDIAVVMAPLLEGDATQLNLLGAGGLTVVTIGRNPFDKPFEPDALIASVLAAGLRLPHSHVTGFNRALHRVTAAKGGGITHRHPHKAKKGRKARAKQKKK